MANNSTPRRYASVEEAAAYLRVKPRTIRQAVADGRLTGYKLGARVLRLDLNEVDAALIRVGGDAG